MNKEISRDILRKIDKVLKPFEPSREEVLAQYGEEMKRCWKEYQRARTPSFAETVHELWQGLAIRVLEGMQEIRAGLAELSFEPKGATRGARAAVPATEGETTKGPKVTDHLFMVEEKGCYGVLRVKPALKGRLDLGFELRDKQQRPMKGFYLTVRKTDGTVVLDRKQVLREDFRKKDVEAADYLFFLESLDGVHTVQLGFQSLRQ